MNNNIHVCVFIIFSEPLLKKMGLLDSNNHIECPQQIFNMDECGVGQETATMKKAYGVKGEQSFHQKVYMHAWE